MSLNSSDVSQTKKTVRVGHVVAVIGAVAAFLVAFFLTRPMSSVEHPAVGLPGPELDLMPLFVESSDETAPDATEGSAGFAGKPVEGKVTVLHFWGTWCPPCVAEYPHLVEMMKKRESNAKLQFIPVSCESGSGETFEGIQKKTVNFYAKINIASLPTFVDASGKTRESVTQAIGTGSMMYPTTVVIDQSQRIAGVWQGYSEASLVEMELLVDKLLKRAG